MRRLFLLLSLALSASGEMIVGPWVPKFKGVDFSVSTNTRSTSLPHLQVVSAFRIDLTDADIRLFTTPRRADYVEGVREVGGFTVSDFLKNNHLQAAINANFFDARSYYLPANTPMDVYGLAISEGVVVSPQDEAQHAAVLAFDENNRATIIHTNWPAANTDGMFTAVAGNYPLVVNGLSVAKRSGNLEADPRTAFGVSQDRRYLYLVGIDGRQPGYSEGAYDYETAEWLLALGAYDGVNMDGGGSTTLVLESSSGQPVRLNHSSAVADSGRERTVGSHFGVFAKPLLGFINDVRVNAFDRAADITWTTIEPATARVEFGLSDELGMSTVENSELATNHSVRLEGLTPDTQYFYQIVAGTNISPLVTFKTTNYVTTNLLFDITQPWKYSTSNLDDVDWTSPTYDDSSWSALGAGLLWVDVRSSPVELPQPRNTQMEANPATAYPFTTYYFRTKFNLPEVAPGTSLALSAYVDDGLVLYLNGAEIWRLRVASDATADSLAIGYGCEGDATCADEYLVPASALANLKAGDNVLAAEVHNYNARSADITFGLIANLVVPIANFPQLSIELTASRITLRWDGSNFRVQSSSTLNGPWLDETLTSPAAIDASDNRRFYRLAPN
jgi:hypothetical protein